MTGDPLDDFARIVVTDRAAQLRRPVAEAARLAYVAGGPTVAELEALIVRLRAERAA